jgi:predicted kinase
MIVIINGSVGVGKSLVSWELQSKFDKSIMLDGDYIGAVHPFEIYDEKRTQYLYDTLQHLVNFHLSHGYEHFVINYVFESAKSLENLIKRFDHTGLEIHCFWLTASLDEQRKRILARNTDQVDWELNRFSELNQIQGKASLEGFIGDRIDSDGKSVEEVVGEICRVIAIV